MSLLCLTLFLSGCGNQSNTPELETDPKNAPGSTTPTNTGNTGAAKWTSQQLTSQSQYCAQAGDTTYYDESAWLTFCKCSYTAASKRWTYDEFFANFKTNYTTLYNEGSIPECLRQAGMTNYLAK